MSAGGKPQALQLFVLRDGDLVASEMFGEGTYLLGPDPESDVRLDHPAVAQVQLEFLEGKVRLSGSGGFHLNGIRVAEAELSSADDVWLGPFLLKTRLMARRRISTPPGSSGKSHRTGGAALALVPAPPPPPAMEFDFDEVEQLLSTPLQAAPEPLALGELESEALLTPLPEAPPSDAAPPAPAKVEELAPPFKDVAPAQFEDLTQPEAIAPTPAPREAARIPRPPAPPREAARIAQPPPPPRDTDRIPRPPLPQRRETDRVPLPAPREAARIARPPPPPLELEPALEESAANAVTAELAPIPAAMPVATSNLLEVAKTTPAPPALKSIEPSRKSPPPAQKPAAAARESDAPARVAKPAASSRPGAGPGLRSSGGVVHARVFWQETLLFSSSMLSGAKARSSSTDAEALEFYGFAAEGAPLVRANGPDVRVALAKGVQAFQRTQSGWTPAEPSAAAELPLPPGSALRLSNGRFHLELSAQPAPKRAGGSLGRDLDLRMLVLLLLLGGSLAVLIHSLPKVLPVQPLEPEVYRHVQLTIKKDEKPKPKLRPAEPAPKPVVPLAQVTSLKQVDVPLHSLDKITKATKGLSSLLASLTAAPSKKNPNTILTPVDRGPAPLPSLGGTGASGPITKGNELLRGGRDGLLSNATGGQGDVRGVPVSIPKRPSRVQGSIDRDAVAAVINEKVGEMRACYERALLSDPNLGAGKVLLEWTIDPSGSVSEVRTKTATLRSSEVIGCVLDLVRGLKFPKPNSGVVIITYPVLFNSVGY